MDLARREFLVGGGVSLAGVAGGILLHLDQNGQEAGGSVPAAAKTKRPVAISVHEQIAPHFQESAVYVISDGIAFEYASTAGSPDDLTREIHTIADKYAEIIRENDHEPLTLTIVTSEVQAIVPESSLRAYVNDEINKEAYHETIEITDRN